MIDQEVNFFVKKLCSHSKLGVMHKSPEPLTGGLLHKIFRVETDRGKFAVKILNPQIMNRPQARDSYIHSEMVASFLAEKLPALPAKVINGTQLQKFEDQYFLVYDWIIGKTKPLSELNSNHARLIGSLLGEIHNSDIALCNIKMNIPQKHPAHKWNIYLQKGKENHSAWTGLLAENSTSLYKWSAAAEKAAPILSSDLVISHRDLDPKNVMWNDSTPVIIDWESAGFIHPMQDLLETALYWSVNDIGELQEDSFSSFLKGYKSKGKELTADWKSVLDAGYSAKLDWLEYNLKRSLWIECGDKEEQQLGTEQVYETIDELKRYEEQIPDLLKWLDVKFT
ncbi:aminoglycoside phosphotransferase family protein [Bacillus sp. P14.5]|uniref:aminoglycoside phosphotransferase family protein n=1 Tax=Bacillus sp. P14.5 TaxID=1983400 RepID=UPI000DE9AB14|nr:aminoglycoside phosphotransferase family protein [Bacillus sp. P14.5]